MKYIINLDGVPTNRCGKQDIDKNGQLDHNFSLEKKMAWVYAII